MSEPAALVKFGQDNNMSQFRNEGLLYMNNLPYFRGIEDKELRGDPCDSVDKFERGQKADISLPDGTKLPIKVTNWDLRIGPSNADKINVFCMYALRPLAGTFPVNEKNFRFGDVAIVVIDINEFIDRIKKHLRQKHIEGKAQLVEYIDDDYTGEVGAFRKFKKFSYQSEWRLVCKDGPGGPRKLRIGSIKDISVVVPIQEINEIITVSS